MNICNEVNLSAKIKIRYSIALVFGILLSPMAHPGDNKIGVRFSDLMLTLGSNVALKTDLGSLLYFMSMGTTGYGFTRREDNKFFTFNHLSNSVLSNKKGWAFSNSDENYRNAMFEFENQRFIYAADRNKRVYFLALEKNILNKQANYVSYSNAASNANNIVDIEFASSTLINQIGRHYLIDEKVNGKGVNKKYTAIFSKPSTCIPEKFKKSFNFIVNSRDGFYSRLSGNFLSRLTGYYFINNKVKFDRASGNPFLNTNCEWVSEVRITAAGYVSYIGFHGSYFRESGFEFVHAYNATPIVTNKKKVSPF